MDNLEHIDQNEREDDMASHLDAKPTPPPQIMAKSVTRHDVITEPKSWELLASGIDTLDLGLYVNWGRAWHELSRILDDTKEQAKGTKGVPSICTSLGQSITLPAGKPRYRWHLQWAQLHLWIAQKQEPDHNWPNVYCSLTSHTLWQNGLENSVSLVKDLIAELLGELVKCVPGRCDICTDFKLDTDLELDFLQAAIVSKSSKRRTYMNGSKLETLYVGNGGSAIQFRFYNKVLEVAKPGGKTWMWDIWNTNTESCIWRVEVQLRRQSLKQFGIISIDLLKMFVGGIWQSLTNDWCSVRILDDTNTTRRSIHPWWLAVQSAANTFGEVHPIDRNLEPVNENTLKWYISHMSGCLPGYAALSSHSSLDAAIAAISKDFRLYWQARNWKQSYIVTAVRRGTRVEVDDEIPI